MFERRCDPGAGHCKGDLVVVGQIALRHANPRPGSSSRHPRRSARTSRSVPPDRRKRDLRRLVLQIAASAKLVSRGGQNAPRRLRCSRRYERHRACRFARNPKLTWLSSRKTSAAYSVTASQALTESHVDSRPRAIGLGPGRSERYSTAKSSCVASSRTSPALADSTSCSIAATALDGA